MIRYLVSFGIVFVVLACYYFSRTAVGTPSQLPFFVLQAQAAAAASNGTPIASTTALNVSNSSFDVAKLISSSKGYLDVIRNIRKSYESSPADHRIVEHAYSIMIYAAPNQEFAGTDPFAVDAPKKE